MNWFRDFWFRSTRVQALAQTEIRAAIKQHGVLSGGALAREANLSSAVLYPALIDLEAQGVVESKWHAGDSYPRRRLYSLATGGRGR